MSENLAMYKITKEMDIRFINKVLRYVEIDENFIRKVINLPKIDMVLISKQSCLTEAFFEEFESIIKWNIVAKYHKLSEDFIKKHMNKIPLKPLVKYQNLSEEFLDEFIIDKIPKDIRLISYIPDRIINNLFNKMFPAEAR